MKRALNTGRFKPQQIVGAKFRLKQLTILPCQGFIIDASTESYYAWHYQKRFLFLNKKDWGLIKAIIFDFGRVITAQKPGSLFQCYEKMLGLAPGAINSIMFDSPAWEDALLGRKTAKEFWASIGPALGLKGSNEINTFRHRYHKDEAINPGVLNLIYRLHGRYKLAVLSNSPPGLTRWLSDWKILHWFDLVFCSGDEGVIKPDPIAFKMTLERLGVKPGESVFIDDTKEHVDAARGRGINGIVFTTAESLKNDLAHLLPEQ